MLEIEIDGKQLQVPDGSTVMDAAAQAGSYIPHFCYHKKLSIAANCRMCLVQVEKAPKPLPACATPVTNGMKVWTHSESAVKAQKGVMEFLLINHPLDCPICDQGGECQLQDLAVGYGDVRSRYQEEKRVVANKDLGPLVSTDMTRCINCTRCVRFTQEIAGQMELGQAFRGEHAEIMPFIEKTVDSELSGNIIDLCPVGALTSKPFRFAARTWELSRRKSVSPHDSLGSNLIVQVKHDKVKRVLPLENETLNECWLSDKDRFSYEGLDSAERLTAPMIKRDGAWATTDWQSALEFAAGALKAAVVENGPHAVGALGSPHSTLEELYLLQKLVRGVGSDNVDFRLRQTDFRLDGVTAGAPWLGMPVADIKELDRLLVVGSFLRKDAPLLAQKVRQAAKRGLQVCAVGAVADDWLLPVKHRAVVAPSAMGGVLLDVVKALAEKLGGEVSSPYVSILPASVSAEAEAIAACLAGGQRVAVWLGNMAQQDLRFAELLGLAQEIARLSAGCFGVIGEAANSVGGYVAGATPKAGGRNALQMLQQPPRALVLLGLEPALDTMNPVLARSALSQAACVVSLSAFKSQDLLDGADVLLPVTPFSETSGSFVNCEGRLQSFHAVARPQGEARPAWKVLRVLGNLLGLAGFEQADSEAIRCEVLATTGGVEKALLVPGFAAPVPVRSATGQGGFERVADVPIYQADPLVRRAEALQSSNDSHVPLARTSAATLARIGAAAGARIRVSQDGGVVELVVEQDDAVAEGCVRIPAAHLQTTGLGAMSGVIHVERV
ncbi:MAG: NADH-quinone oxidoreductase subunit NuoG [Rhodocyclaceae bacterium]|jgi:NADH-quinone oxidoreductase subunit G|nr:NADH-quinone oxidoreductase subunit NuoG [Rhodocyclaceae bacterium]